jgi:hypothetical protein
MSFHEIIKNNDLDNKFRKWIREEISDNDKAELEMCLVLTANYVRAQPSLQTVV